MKSHATVSRLRLILLMAMALVLSDLPLLVWADRSATVRPPATRGGSDEDERALVEDLYGGPIGFEAKR